MKEKVKKFIKYCNCISEFDKYFWLKQVEILDDQKLDAVYESLLKHENELVGVELKSIGKIQGLIVKTYPELKEKYLPDYNSIFRDYETIQTELTHEKLQNLRERLKILSQ